MPQVPYQPFSTVKPTDAGPSGISVATPEAAFGGAVAHAISSLGQNVEHAGDELWKRALALQELKNESDAREATSQYMMHVGELHAQFGTLQGKAAVDAYPGYIKDVQDSRKQFMGSLGNDQARKMYDRESMPTMGRTIFNGAGHAASQGKAYAAGTAQARIDATNDYILHNPEDDNAFRTGITQAVQLVRDVKAPIAGWGKDQTDLAVNKERSSLVLARITGLAKTKPFMAQEVLDQQKEDLFGPDLQKAEDVVKTNIYNTGSRMISQEVNGPTELGKREEPLQDRIDRAVKIAEKQRPDDPLFPDFVRDRVTADFNKDKAVKRDAEYTNRNTIAAALTGGVGGKLPITVEELIASSPAVEQAWNGLDAIHQQPYLKALAANAKGDKGWTNDTLRQYQQMKGMSSADPVEFLASDVIGTNLPNSAKRELINLQQRLQSKSEGDPRVHKALQILGPSMQAAGITRDRKDDYYQFVGGLQEALNTFQEQNKRAPKFEEVQAIGKQLMQEQIDPEKWTFGVMKRTTPLYQQSVPEAEEKVIKADPMWARIGVEPTEAQIKEIYIRKRYKELFGGSAKKPQEGPQVPK